MSEAQDTGVSLSKGGNVSLTKLAPGLSKVFAGLRWDPNLEGGADWDLDAWAFLLNADGKVPNAQHFVFYTNKSDPAGSVTTGPDNRSGAGEGDDETVSLNLEKVPADVQRIVIGVSIDEAAARNQNFGQVKGSSIRIVNATNEEQLAVYDLREDASTATAMLFGEVYRHNGEWKFRALGQPAASLAAVCNSYGVTVK